jgi:hypothetical protein
VSSRDAVCIVPARYGTGISARSNALDPGFMALLRAWRARVAMLMVPVMLMVPGRLGWAAGAGLAEEDLGFGVALGRD